MAKATGPTQADILFNENAILAARSQRILQSLLGPPTNGARIHTEKELEEEDAEAFKPEPDELLGLGFPVAENDAPLPGIHNGKPLRPDEKLRKQMLGKIAKRTVSDVASSGRVCNISNVKVNGPRKPKSATTNQRAESDDEEGRSSLGTKKRRMTEEYTMMDVDGTRKERGPKTAVPEIATPPQMPEVVHTKTKPGRYLDEILAERLKKKRRP